MNANSPVFKGQFGEFTITSGDRWEVMIYRAGLNGAALCFALGTGLLLWQGAGFATLKILTGLYGIFCLSLGVSLFTIHIYLSQLHRLLQWFWAIGCGTSLFFALTQPDPLPLYVYQHPTGLVGVGFTFAALTGIFFKEGFCFNRLETKLLTPLVPLLLLGHLLSLLPLGVEPILLASWAGLFLLFAWRKIPQAIPADIGDKSVFAYLKQQRKQEREQVVTSL
jgi:uncharacterized integral membrane protein